VSMVKMDEEVILDEDHCGHTSGKHHISWYDLQHPQTWLAKSNQLVRPFVLSISLENVLRMHYHGMLPK
jgi:hypothetical protein